MSSTQVILLALVLVAFVIGWTARGRRDAAASAPASSPQPVGELDAALAAVLTSFQAVLALWQLEGAGISARGRRGLATFERRREAVNRLAEASLEPAAENEALERARTALSDLAVGLVPYGEGVALEAGRERELLRAERVLSAARTARLLALVGDRNTDD